MSDELRREMTKNHATFTGLPKKVAKLEQRIAELEKLQGSHDLGWDTAERLATDNERLRAALEAVIEYYEEGGNQPITYKRIACKALNNNE